MDADISHLDAADTAPATHHVHLDATTMSQLPDWMPQHIPDNASSDALRQRLNALAAAIGDDAFVARLAREIVARTRPHQAIPDCYDRYRAVVRDGIEFFLSQVDRQRLVELAIHQYELPPDTRTAQRLLELALQFPTLHKLGQLIARNPNIDPKVKKWLVHLENGDYGTPFDAILRQLNRRLRAAGRRDQVRVRHAILSEASVGAAVRFDWRPPSARKRAQGVFKVLKPGIRKQLDAELVILEKTAAFFENRRRHYPFDNFRFLEVFQEVRQIMINEIDLAAEQACLVEAADFFSDMEAVLIPRLLPFSSDTVTAMAYVKGPKITDADMRPAQREQVAGVLFEALVCKPLFSRRASSLFHGDPHAGNILAVEDPVTGRLRIGLLDWTLAGHLKRSDRLKTVQLIQAVIQKDVSRMRRAVKALAMDASWDDPACRNRFRELALGVIQSSEYDRLSHMKKSFKLLEELSYAGFVFPAELMLFRKAIFTLEGVLHDLCPSFDMDAAVTRYMTALIGREMPMRIGTLFFPLADKAVNYPSLMSNTDLQSLLLTQYLDAVGAGCRSLAGTLWGWGRFFGNAAAPAADLSAPPDE